jgi:hypothetical protein
MKIRPIITTIALLILVSLGIQIKAQDHPTLPQQKEAIAKLASLMVGEWSGSGWNKRGQGDPEPVHVKETIERKNDGVSLLIQGIGTHPETKENVHNALAIVYYDVESSTYQFDSHLSSGLHKLSTGTLKNNVFIWGFDLPNNASIRYTITITGDKWNEIGEYSPNKDQWYKIFEMNLDKK